jgi:putative DNA-invertase from lambdoid prophage Rac
MFTIVSAIAELERNILLERVRAGLRRARENGAILGRPKKLNLNVEEIKKMRNKERLSFRQIGKKVGASPALIYKILQKSESTKNP